MTISSQDLLDAAFLASAVYEDNQSANVGQGYTLVSRTELGLGGPIYDPYFDGDYLYDFLGAQGFIASNGAELAIVFRGSDPWDLVGDLFTDLYFSVQYAAFGELIQGFESFIAGLAINKVLVIGHSLGGAIAELFMAHHPNDPKYVGFTFGSPGSGNALGDDDRLLNIGHSGDSVFRFVTEQMGVHGADITVDLPTVPDMVDVLPSNFLELIASHEEHEQNSYISTVNLIGNSILYEIFIQDPNGYRVVAESRFGESNSPSSFKLSGQEGVRDFMLGGFGNDTLAGLSGDDLIDGGTGQDSLSGGDGNDWLAGGQGDDILNGGGGDDSIDGGDQFDFDSVEYLLDQSQYDVTVDGDVVTIISLASNEGTDTVRDVESFLFNGNPVRFEDLEGQPSSTPPPVEPPPPAPPPLPGPPTTGDDFPNNQYTPAQITMSAAGYGMIHGFVEQAKDTDWFKINLVAGHSYQITVLGESSTGAASYLDNTFFRVRHDSAGFDANGRPNAVPQFSDPDGTAWDDVIGADARATYTAPASGQYYISVGGGGPLGVWDTVTGEYWVMVVDVFGGQPPNQAPIAVNDTFAVTYGQTIQGNVLSDNNQTGADYDPDGSLLTVDVISSLSTSSGGTVDVLSNGAFQYIAPASGATTTDSFTYTVRDGAGASASGLVTINLSASGGSFFTEGDDTRTLPAGGGNWYALGGIDLVYGSLSGEAIFGGAGDDRILAGGGNDFIDGGPGSDQLRGGAGDDWIISDGLDSYISGDDVTGTLPGIDHDTLEFQGTAGGVVVDWFGGQGIQAEGIEVVIGTDFADQLSGHDVADNTFYGRGGNDVMRGWGGNDTLYGGDGNDTIRGDSGDDNLFGNDGDDEIRGGDGRNYIDGGPGNDLIYGGPGDDVLTGGEGDDVVLGEDSFGQPGNDYIVASAGTDRLVGVDGVDTVDFSNAPAAAVGGTSVSVSGWGTSTLENIEILIGSSFGDNLQAQPQFTEMHLGAGNDFGFAADSVISIWGDDGDDVLIGGLSGETFYGGEGNDQLIMSNGDNIAFGDGGEDFINGGSGSDTFHGGNGDDTLTSGGGSDSLFGDSGDDLLDAGPGDDSLSGGLGNDTYVVDAAGDVVTENADEGIDTIQTTLAGYTLGANVENLTFTDAGTHTGVGNTLDNVLTGGPGNDTLIGGAGEDTLLGGTGSDLLLGTADGDVIDGGSGSDTASYSGSDAGVTVNLAAGTATGGHATGDTLISIENLVGSSHDDTLMGNGSNNVINGAGGADMLDGGGGSDTASYTGSDAAVTVNLGTGAASGGYAEGDVLTGFENLVGSSHDDMLTGNGGANALNGAAGADMLDGGGGSDTASYTGSNAGVTVNLATGTATGGYAEGDTLTSIESLVGSSHDDMLTGNAGANALNGAAGADVLDGGGGTDTASYTGSNAGVTVNLGTGSASGGYAQGDTLTSIESLVGSSHDDALIGNGGANALNGGAGADMLNGSGGIDTASYTGSNAGVTVDLGTGSASGGYAEGDTLISIENLVGSAHDDTLTGNGGANALNGSAGADTLNGGGGTDTASYTGSNAGVTVNLATGTGSGGYAQGDTLISIESLYGSSFADTLTGDGAANGLTGGAGADALDGGGGTDTASYAASGAAVMVDLSTGTGSGGDAAGDTLDNIENLYGSSHDDTLTGNDANNVLFGVGGADTLNGAAGNDTLIGGAGGDALNGGSGTDTAAYVGSSVGVTVNLGTGAASGGDAAGDTFSSIENLTGSSQSDMLTGSGSNNVLNGGLGNDILAGEAGADTVVFNSALNAATNVDSLTDFEVGMDIISLENAIFSAFAVTGALAAEAFFAGAGATAAQDASDRIVYDTTTGALYYDSDGVSGAAAIQFALLTTSPDGLTQNDFMIF